MPPQLPSNQDDSLQMHGDNEEICTFDIITRLKRRFLENKPSLGNLSRIKSSKTSWSTCKEAKNLSVGSVEMRIKYLFEMQTWDSIISSEK